MFLRCYTQEYFSSGISMIIKDYCCFKLKTLVSQFMVDTFSSSSFNVVVLRSSLTTVSTGKPISTFSEVLKKSKKPLKKYPFI